MIISLEELKTYIQTDVKDAVLEEKLNAIELMIRKVTNNNFQVRAIRTIASSYAAGSLIECDEIKPFSVGDTIQISESEYMPGMLRTIKTISDHNIIVNEDLFDEDYVLITKIYYPQDVKMGVVNMLQWDLNNRDKVGIQSETISRHSVTYFNMDGENASMGYPKSLMDFLKPYKKARF